MGTAAELFGFAHLHHTDSLAVFFSKQCHRTGLFRLFHGHDLCHHRHIRLNLCIDKGLHSGDLLRRHRGKMAEIKT